MNDQAQYSNMMDQINQINSQGREIVNEKKEDQQEKLNEYKKTLEMTTEGIGGGILHDTGISLIKKGFSAIKNKIPVPLDELENMVADYKKGGAKKMFQGMTKRGYSKAKTKMFGDAEDGEDGETAVKKVFGNIFKKAKTQTSSTIGSVADAVAPVTPAAVAAAGAGAVAPAVADDDIADVTRTEPKYDNISSKSQFLEENNRMKDKLNTLDKGTQKQIKKGIKADTNIKSASEIQAITDPKDKLAEATKRSKAFNDRINDIPPEQSLEDKAKTTLTRIGAPLDTPDVEEDAPKATGFFSKVASFFSKTSGEDDDKGDPDGASLQPLRQIEGKFVKGKFVKDVEGEGSALSGIGGKLLGAAGQAGQAGGLIASLTQKGEDAKQRAQALAQQAKQAAIQKAKDLAQDVGTKGLSTFAAEAPEDDAAKTAAAALKKAATKGVEDDVKDDVKSTAEKAGERLVETDAELGGAEDPVGDVVSGLVGLGTLLGGIFGAKRKHLPPVAAYVPLNQSFQSGA